MMDILYKNSVTVPKISPDTAAALLLEETLSGVNADINICKKMSDIISELQTDPENIRWRTEAMNDFIAKPSMLSDLENASSQFAEIEHEKGTVNSISHRKSVDMTGVLLPVTVYSGVVVKLLRLYLFINRTLATAESENLSDIRNFTGKICTKAEYKSLGDLCSELSAIRSGYMTVTVAIKLEKTLRVGEIDLVSLTDREDDFKPKKSFFRKPPEPEKTVSFGQSMEAREAEYRYVLSGVQRLLVILESIYGFLKKPLTVLFSGLFFYRFGYDLNRILTELKLPCTVAKLSTGGTVINNMYDLWLIFSLRSKGLSPSSVLVPNSIDQKRDPSMIISGKNGGGKTVFLRGYGLIQLLAQAGLPVPATSVFLTPTNGIFACFAASDKGQGRFSDEVKTLSDTFDRLMPENILLLNEIYQSTSFTEASPALTVYLRAVKKLGVKAVVVTHLPDMKKHLPDFGFFIAEDGFRIVKDELI